MDTREAREKSAADLYVSGQYSGFTLDARSSEFGVNILKVRQPAGHYPHPETSELWIGLQTMGGGRARLDLGAGYFAASLTPGDALIRSPNIQSLYELEHDHSFSLISIDLRDPYLAAADELGYAALRFEHAMSSAVRVPLLEPLTEHLWETMNPGEPVEKIMAETAAILLLSIIARQSQLVRGPSAYRGGLTPHHMKKLKAFMADNYHTDISIATLASLLGISTSHFVRAFRHSFGVTPYKYLTGLRAEQARKFLADTPDCLDQVAFKTGFLNRQNLLRAFKRLYGLSPSKIRRS